MMDVEVSRLRQQLPEYLARVRQGERVRVMSRGRVVAELVPPAASANDDESAGARPEGSLSGNAVADAPRLSDSEWKMNRE